MFSQLFPWFLASQNRQDFSSCLSLARRALEQLHGPATLAEAAEAAAAATTATTAGWGTAQEAFRTWLG